MSREGTGGCWGVANPIWDAVSPSTAQPVRRLQNDESNCGTSLFRVKVTRKIPLAENHQSNIQTVVLEASREVVAGAGRDGKLIDPKVLIGG